MRCFHTLIDHTTFDGARNWCACTLAFFGVLRINEYCNGKLKHRHVHATPVSVSLLIPFHKSNLQPTRVELAARTDQLCPVRALTAYLAFFSVQPSLPHGHDTALFVSVQHRPRPTVSDMTDIEFIANFRDLLHRSHPFLDTSQYAGHSFRRGGSSALKQWGATDAAIQRHGRWRSDAYRQYIGVDHNSAVRLQVTQAIPDFAT